jgi:23S rRNA (cytosine1962-C5)-methyltransferase
MQMLVAEGWRDYELLDSGEGRKLERWGQYVVVRPEPRAIWNKKNPDLWKEAAAVYEDEGWKFMTAVPEEWTIGYDDIKFRLKPTEFKHTGVFPEQAANWQWIRQRIANRKSHSANILNLFAYTGGATIAAASNAAVRVTHVDASRPAMMWASENCALSRVPKERVRWIQDDAMKFVQREIRRGVKYEGIIMDPPKFGRGANGEIWKLDENFPKLAHECRKILSETPLFFLINAYTADLSHLAIQYVLEDVVAGLNGKVESGELGLLEASAKRVLPAGIWARWGS